MRSGYEKLSRPTNTHKTLCGLEFLALLEFLTLTYKSLVIVVWRPNYKNYIKIQITTDMTVLLS